MPNCPACKTNIPTTPLESYHTMEYQRIEKCSKCLETYYIDKNGNIACETECSGCLVRMSRSGQPCPCHNIPGHHKIPGYFIHCKKGKKDTHHCRVRNPITGGTLSCSAFPNFHETEIHWEKMPIGFIPRNNENLARV